ncbi:MAG: PEP-CTERM sorting domain-containing protein [Phycisphaerae bacterium]|nr:PEP-CTERM sorting domain-containing protein [Phycisphaerae bacterium]
MTNVKMKKPVRAVMAIAVLCMLPGLVQADSLGTVKLEFAGVNPHRHVETYYDGSYLGNLSTGQYIFRVDTDGGDATGEGIDVQQMALDNSSNPGYIGAFCSDLFQGAPGSTYWTTYDVEMPEHAPHDGNFSTPYMTDAKADDLRWLYNDRLASVVSDNTAAAFQLSVWEIIYETSADYSVSNQDGIFYTNSPTDVDAVALANAWLDDVELQTGDAPDIRLRVLTDPCTQDYSMILPDPSTPPVVPEPLTLLGVALGIGGLGGYIRKRFGARVG